MNRELLNKILTEALYAGDSISSNVNILFVDQEMPIDVRLFQNPITDYGDVRLQSIDSSERIANLIDSFGSVLDIEERYRFILNGIQNTTLFAITCASASTENLHDPYEEINAQPYVALSRQIRKIMQENHK